MTRRAGETVVLQEVWAGQVWAARPMTLVRDEDDLVALWFPRGTRWQAPTTPSTRAREPTRGERFATLLQQHDWAFVEHEWDVDTLQLLRPGDWHAVWVSWLADGSHWGWYVNLQRPYERTSIGFRTMDLMLDVLIDPSGAWRYKDEDELETLVKAGVFDAATARRVRDEARHVIERAQRNEPPFGEPWPEWQPDPSWAQPVLPRGWDRVVE